MGKKLKRGLFWRNGVIWIRTHPITGKATSTRCHTSAAAEAWRAEQERLAADPRYAASLASSVGDWVKRTIAYKRAGKASGTVHMYTVKLGHIVRIFGVDAPLAKITPGTVDLYVTQRQEEGVKNNTIKRELTCLRQMLRLAKRAGSYLPDLAEIMPVGFSAEYKPVTRVLKPADLPALLAGLQNDEERAWVCFALATAADVGDIDRARPEDYDATRNVMRIRGTKTTTRDAEVPILPHVAELFAFALPFLPINWPRASKGVGDACRRSGLPHLSPKDLRRSAASWLVAAGANQSLVSRFLRHKSDAMVRLVYGQIKPEELGALLSGGVTSTLHQHPRPLGGMADAGDLKGHSILTTGETVGELQGSEDLGRARKGVGAVTPALHPIPALALSYAAEFVLRPLVKTATATVAARKQEAR